MRKIKKPKVILQGTCSELVMRFETITKSELLAQLSKIGIKEIEKLEDFWSSTRFKEGTPEQVIKEYNAIEHLLIDKDNPNTPDFKHHAIITIDEDFEGYRGEEHTLALEAHQHTQHQLYPTLDKIETHFKKGFNGFDGGGTEWFEKWKKEGKQPIKDYNEEFKARREALWK